jgi:predicted nucleic acid-binding Zn ribbon protein
VDTITRAQAKRQGETHYFTGAPCAYGHIAERYVRNYTCVECEYARKRGDALECVLSACVICGGQVRVPGNVTCSPVCRELWQEAKARAGNPKRCHGCGGIHKRHRKWFCSDECRDHHQQERASLRAISPELRQCIICGAAFHTKRKRSVCSSNCAKKREVWRSLATTQWRQRNDRENYARYIRNRNRDLRARIAAAIAIARELEVVPKKLERERDDQGRYLPRVTDSREQRRRLYREKYAVMLAFKELGLLPTGEQT